jgi:hypothetical protein
MTGKSLFGTRKIAQIFFVWLVIRVLTSLTAIFASPLRSLTDLERSLSVWPPSSPFSLWFTRSFLSPFERWDVKWYIKIVSEGYTRLSGTAQFHPLYPMSAKIFNSFGLNPLASLFLVSTITSLVLLFSFYLLARLDLPENDALFALLLFIVAPPSFVIFAPYPEGLFLVFAIGCLYFARYQKWWLASLAGALAVLTRQQGLLLIIPILWEYWEAMHRKWQECLKEWKAWFAFSLIPLAMISWISYRAITLNDLRPDFSSFNSFIYSVLISPHADQVVPEQVFLPPWLTVWHALEKLFSSPDSDIIVNLVGALLFVIIFVMTWPHLRVSYRIYSLLIVLISLSYYTGFPHPTMGLLRHLVLAFPIFIGIPSILRRPSSRLVWLTASALGLVILVTLYVLEAWVV